MITIKDAIINNTYVLFDFIQKESGEKEVGLQDNNVYILNEIFNKQFTEDKFVTLFYDVIHHLDAHSTTNMTKVKRMPLEEFLLKAKTYFITV